MTNLLVDTPLKNEQREYINVVRNSAQNLLTILNDILDFSKIEAGKLDLEILDFDLRITMENISDLFALKAFEKNINFSCLVFHDVPSNLKGDPGRLKQILINLTNNALKFTEQGEVSMQVELLRENDRSATIKFSVIDTGIGIPQEERKRLFKSFTQVDASTTRKYGGTGLGLSIARQLVEIMGGKIEVESTPGEGSIFWFNIVFEKQSKAEDHFYKRVNEVQKQRILIVDDFETNRFVLKEQLKFFGCQFDEADSATNGLKKLQKATKDRNPFQIVITDMLMPGVDGKAFGKLVKEDSVLKETILIMLTSVGERGDANLLKDIGFAAYLLKPIKHSQLYDCLETVVQEKDKSVKNGDENSIITRHSLAERRKRKTRILLVEDNAINQKVALKMLEKLGFLADVAFNGLEALQALETIPYDIVLMDVQMPEMDGLEATRAIRSTESKVLNHKVPIIAMTAHAMKGDKEKCLEAGMDDYITKPVKSDELFSVIQKQINHQPISKNGQ